MPNARNPSERRPRAAACLLGLLASASLVMAASVAGAASPAPSKTPAQTAPAQAPLATVPIGQALPHVVMNGLNGPARSLASYRGRPLIVNVWASWCGPCRAEAASLERLAWSKAGARYTVIGVSTDDYREEALRWLKHSRATINHYIDTAPHWPLEHLLGGSTIPVTVLVDAQGRVVGRFRGAREWDTAESIRLIESTFGAAAPPARKR